MIDDSKILFKRLCLRSVTRVDAAVIAKILHRLVYEGGVSCAHDEAQTGVVRWRKQFVDGETERLLPFGVAVTRFQSDAYRRFHFAIEIVEYQKRLVTSRLRIGIYIDGIPQRIEPLCQTQRLKNGECVAADVKVSRIPNPLEVVGAFDVKKVASRLPADTNKTHTKQQ